MRFLILFGSLSGFLLGMGPLHAEQLPDRALRKEPPYLSKAPLYGLAVFGPKADRAVWMVLDKTKPDAAGYDLLYLDLNGDRDLTGPGEKLMAGPDGQFKLVEFKDPATGVKHQDFTLRLRPEGKDFSVMVGVRWKGQFRFGGGYPEDPDAGYLHFARRPADAPVLWIYGDGPFRFQRWYGGKLTIGEANDFKVFLGQPGQGRSAFCAAKEHILPSGEWVKAILIYRNSLGKEQRLVCELKERC